MKKLREAVTDQLKSELGHRPGIAVYFDKSIEPGQDWERWIESSLNASSFVVSVITRGYFTSEWCCKEVKIFRQREAELGRGRMIFPILIHDIDKINPKDTRQVLDPDVHSYLKTCQLADFRHLRNGTSKTKRYRDAVEKLVEAIVAAIMPGETECSPETGTEQSAAEPIAADAQTDAHGTSAPSDEPVDSELSDPLSESINELATALVETSETPAVEDQFLRNHYNGNARELLDRWMFEAPDFNRILKENLFDYIFKHAKHIHVSLEKKLEKKYQPPGLLPYLQNVRKFDPSNLRDQRISHDDMLLSFQTGSSPGDHIPQPIPPDDFDIDQVRDDLIAGREPPEAWLPFVTTLDLGKAPIRRLEPLARLHNLVSLWLDGTGIKDIRPLTSLSRLEILDLSATPVSNFRPLAALGKLEELHLADTTIADLSPLQQMSRLAVLDISATRVASVAPLQGLHSMAHLRLADSRVADVAPLAGLQQLKKLDLSGAPVQDLRPLDQLVAGGLRVTNAPRPARR